MTVSKIFTVDVGTDNRFGTLRNGYSDGKYWILARVGHDPFHAWTGPFGDFTTAQTWIPTILARFGFTEWPRYRTAANIVLLGKRYWQRRGGRWIVYPEDWTDIETYNEGTRLSIGKTFQTQKGQRPKSAPVRYGEYAGYFPEDYPSPKAFPVPFAFLGAYVPTLPRREWLELGDCPPQEGEPENRPYKFAIPELSTFQNDPLGQNVLVLTEPMGPVPFDREPMDTFTEGTDGHSGVLPGWYNPYPECDVTPPMIYQNGDDFSNHTKGGAVFFARPFTPLADDDGETLGYYFAGVEYGYDYSHRTVQQSFDGADGIKTFARTITHDAEKAATYRNVVQHGLQTFPLWTDHLYDGGEGGSTAYPTVFDSTLDYPAGYDNPRTDYWLWEVGIWYRAKYILRSGLGVKVFYSDRGRTSARIASFRRYPMPSKLQSPLPALELSGNTRTGTPIFTDNYHVIETGTDVEELGYAPTDSLNVVMPDVPGVVGWHNFAFRHVQGNQNPLGNILETGRLSAQGDTSLGDYHDGGSSISEVIQSGGILQIGNADAVLMNVAAYPIYSGVSNGGTVSFDCDTIEYTASDGAEKQTMCAGPYPMQIINHYVTRPSSSIVSTTEQIAVMDGINISSRQGVYTPDWIGEGAYTTGEQLEGYPYYHLRYSPGLVADGTLPIPEFPMPGPTANVCGSAYVTIPTYRVPTSYWKGTAQIWVLHLGQFVPDNSDRYTSVAAPLELAPGNPKGLSAAYWSCPDVYYATGPGDDPMTGLPAIPLPCPTGKKVVGYTLIDPFPLFADGPVIVYINADNNAATPGVYNKGDAVEIGHYTGDNGHTYYCFDRPVAKG